MRRSVRYLTVEEVVLLHDDLLEEDGGLPGILKQAQLESAVMEPQQTWDGQDLYAGLWMKAAVLLRGLACNHAFADGNKRTAGACVLTFLRLNRIDLRPRHRIFELLVVAVASGELRSVETIALALQELRQTR